MSTISSFSPVANSDARLLVLGSMPGEMSLEKGQYYAHPRNQFWLIIKQVFEVSQDLEYCESLALLKDRHIALWDVLKSCRRTGSLDSAIQEEKANDFITFFKAYPSIKTVCFNGKKAGASFRKHVFPVLDIDRFSFHTMPSTSPAYAGLSFEGKYQAWREVLKVK
ncbi:MAG: DNA-deoxyinosine glycosylase [Rhodospirillales bacterium]|nr:DNA-deoxyinosine glycosylase [Alphaproteobacteria bacterium]USO05192.1 MAG: DNA-deoxyinosine glycosylase [Rhodospirillales bacterium]